MTRFGDLLRRATDALEGWKLNPTCPRLGGQTPPKKTSFCLNNGARAAHGAVVAKLISSESRQPLSLH